MTALSGAIGLVRGCLPQRVVGRVAALRGMTVLVEDLPLPVGSMVEFGAGADGAMRGEVVGFAPEHAVVMMLGASDGVRPGDAVTGVEVAQTTPVGPALLGRCIDGLGRPIDGLGPIRATGRRAINPEPVSALRRRRITAVMPTGLRCIDLMTTLGRGQRLGVFAGPGVGKSTLLGSIARGGGADVSVIALVGERGREVRDFIDHSLGPEGLARSVVVVATGDESPLMRLRAARVACTVAEGFRDDGRDVLLMMDSITRFAHAQRQVGLSVGEPPATKGYTPSVFAQMARLLERAGAVLRADGTPGGSITGLYTILVEGDDATEPVSDAARGILDGHVMLSRRLAQRGQFPAVDVLDSVSRVADDIVTPEHSAARRQLTRMLALYREVEDLVQIGAYTRGANPETDVAIDFNRRIVDLLKQGKGEAAGFEAARAALVKLAKETGDTTQRLMKGRAG